MRNILQQCGKQSVGKRGAWIIILEFDFFPLGEFNTNVGHV